MHELPKAYDPKDIEPKWLSLWEKGRFFHADPHSKKPPFCIVIPPPNVTGVLHMGHALVDTLQDILIRWKRMLGFEALWVPGTDHAGIATQTVVEKNLYAKTGKRRKDFDRDEFLKEVWDWKEKSEGHILGQLKRLGCSCDWERLRFTMDPSCNKAVRACFKKMFDDGLIYQGDYLVNWDPVTQTALSDDEVEHEERDSFLWHIRYPLEDGSAEVVVATTRPETMLGDTAVAVHPSDARYAKLVGKNVRLPLTGRLIPILADPFVDPAFGSGAVKITPAHDFNDFEVGHRHKLPFLNIMTPDGHIKEGPYAGLAMLEARGRVVADLKAQGFLVKQEPHKLRVGLSYRSKAVLEPYLSKQWFVKMSHFKDKLISAVKDKRVRLIPPHWEATYFHWIENLRDWCISRQLWWGHRIPIWFHTQTKKVLCYDGEGLPPEVEKHPDQWIQDPDVLDTWFSSALWPFSVLGWPDKTPELAKFYPTSTLITGHDILFFWVARMILMGEYTLGQVPFHETFLHGLIYGKSYWRENAGGGVTYATAEEKKKYDLGTPVPKEVHSKWEKMSKSKGNVIDPLEISAEYGTDALRFALTASVTHARQIDLDRRRFEEYKNFANKIWNGSRFVFMNLEGDFSGGLDEELLTLEDHWILATLQKTIAEVHRGFTEYTFDKAATRAYEFFWNDFCATYVEIAKPVLFGKVGNEALKANKQRLLVILLSNAIRLMHPIAPFITEEIFSLLKERVHQFEGEDPFTRETARALRSPACAVAPYPESVEMPLDTQAESTFAFMLDLVHAVRNIRAEMQLAPSDKTELYLSGTNLETAQIHQTILTALTPTSRITFGGQKAPSGASALVHGIHLQIPLPASLQAKEKQRLEKEREKLEKLLATTQEKLANPEFCSRAPQEVVAKLQTALHDTAAQLKEIRDKLNQLS